MAPVEPMKIPEPNQPQPPAPPQPGHPAPPAQPTPPAQPAAPPKKVKVKAAAVHTAFGQSYKEGDVYEVDEEFVVSLESQKKAYRVNPA